jgi:hypothetical protein
MAKKQLPAKGRKGKGSRYDRLVAIGILITLVVIGFALWGPLRKYRVSEVSKPSHEHRKDQPSAGRADKKTDESSQVSGKEKSARSREKTAPARSPEKAALVAIVIDDLGQDLKPAREILSIPARLTFAVMPGLPQSRKIAELAKQNNRELFVHLPMEYRGKKGKPAVGMLRSDMTPMDFLNTLSDDLASVPGAIGVNNHEGSSLTENKEAMKFLMAELKARGLVFLDSLTSPKSLAYATAREFGLKAIRRDVFLDNDSENEASIRKQLDELARIARAEGQAVGIGHPHPATINQIRAWISEAEEQHLEIVPLSRLTQ